MRKPIVIMLLLLLNSLWAGAQTQQATTAKHRQEKRMSRKERKEWEKVPSDKDREKTFSQGEQRKQRGYKKLRPHKAPRAKKARRTKTSSDRNKAHQ
jgi:hypothetical protein